MTNSVDIIANSISLIQPDGTLKTLTIGGTIAPVNNPTFTGTGQGVTADSIGLGQVNNTSDLNKPLSIATQHKVNTVIADTGAPLTSHIKLINTNTASISSLNASVNTINANLATDLSLIYAESTAITNLITSTNNTFASQLGLINANGSNISILNIYKRC
jgi:hypothetical protein